MKILELLWDARDGAEALEARHGPLWLVEADIYAALDPDGDGEATSVDIPSFGAEVYAVPAGGGVLGSAPGSAIRIQGDGVSARHAELEARPGGVLAVRDLSTRGTTVNGAPVPARVALPLTPGGELGLGRLRLRLVRADQLCRAFEPLLDGLPESRPLPPGANLIARCASIGSVLLPEATPVILGRAKDAGLVLPHPNVSRYHVSLTRSGDVVRVRDLGSSNGTWIGRTQVGQGNDTLDPQRAGALRVGPFELSIHVLCGEDEGTGTGGQSKVETRRVEDLSLSGRLEALPLRQLLHSIEFHERSGSIHLDAIPAVLVFFDGAPRWATYGELVGPAALRALLELEAGAFRFEPAEAEGELLEPPHEDARLVSNFTAALLEHSVRVDEGEPLPTRRYEPR